MIRLNVLGVDAEFNRLMINDVGQCWVFVRLSREFSERRPGFLVGLRMVSKRLWQAEFAILRVLTHRV